MKIGALANSLKKPLGETLEVYSKMGLQGIQLGLWMDWLKYSDSELESIRKQCAEKGLEISAVCGDLGGDPFHIEAECMVRAEILCRFADIAVKLGTRVITTHIGVVPEDKNDPVWPLMKKSIRHAAEHSAKFGVTFAIETGPEQPEVLRAFIEDVGSEGLGVNLDPANLRMVSCVDPVHAVEVLGKYIVHTHAKDGVNLYPGSAKAMYGMCNPDGTKRVFAERPAEYKEVPLGQGQVPWDAYLAALRKAGFNGFLTIERECGNDPEGDIRIAYDFLKNKIG